MVIDDKVKQVMSSIKAIPLSDTTAGRWVEVLATDVFDTLLVQLRKAEFIFLAVDPLTVRTPHSFVCLCNFLMITNSKRTYWDYYHWMGEKLFFKRQTGLEPAHYRWTSLDGREGQRTVCTAEVAALPHSSVSFVHN